MTFVLSILQTTLTGISFKKPDDLISYLQKSEISSVYVKQLLRTGATTPPNNRYSYDCYTIVTLDENNQVIPHNSSLFDK